MRAAVKGDSPPYPIPIITALAISIQNSEWHTIGSRPPANIRNSAPMTIIFFLKREHNDPEIKMTGMDSRDGSVERSCTTDSEISGNAEAILSRAATITNI